MLYACVIGECGAVIDPGFIKVSPVSSSLLSVPGDLMSAFLLKSSKTFPPKFSMPFEATRKGASPSELEMDLQDRFGLGFSTSEPFMDPVSGGGINL